MSLYGKIEQDYKKGSDTYFYYHIFTNGFWRDCHKTWSE